MVERPADGVTYQDYTPDDVTGDCARLIRARWIAGGLVLLITATTVHMMGLSLPETELYATSAGVLAYNGLFNWLLLRARSHNRVQSLKYTQSLINLQIMLDWLTLAIFIHLTGGISSPVIPFLLAHIALAAVLLPGLLPFLSLLLDAGALTLIAILEKEGLITHYSVIPGFLPDTYTNPVFIAVLLGCVLLAGCAISYTVQAVVLRLHQRESRIGALLHTTRVASATTDISDLLTALTCASAECLSANGALIRLLEEASESFTVASACGMSKIFLKHATVDLSQHVLETNIMAGEPVIIDDVATDARIRQPQPLVAEGMLSMMAAPIVGRARPFGILSVYSDKPRHFTIPDTEFLLAIGRQSGTALEHAMAYDRLQKADEERAKFVTMVTHELRAPVAGTQVLLKTLVRGIAGDLSEQQRDILVRIDNRIEMLMALVNDLLALAASKTIDLQEPLNRVLIRPIFNQVVDRFGKEAQSKQVDVTLDIPFEALSVRATEQGLARVLDNLVGNAIKYTPAGGHVCVGVVERPAGVVITVSDTGIGIPENEIPRVLDGFFRAHNARESGIIGTGLGLSIVKQFVDFFGGSISIDSALGKGTTFKVTLQRAGPADEVVEA